MTPETWAEAAPLLQRALDRSSDPETLEDVKQALLDGEAQIWLAEGTAVVTVVDAPDVNVWLYSGNLGPMAGLFTSCAAWARALGLKRMTVVRARRGWERALKPLGFVPAEDAQLARKL